MSCQVQQFQYNVGAHKLLLYKGKTREEKSNTLSSMIEEKKPNKNWKEICTMKVCPENVQNRNTRV